MLISYVVHAAERVRPIQTKNVNPDERLALVVSQKHKSILRKYAFLFPKLEGGLRKRDKTLY